MIESPINSEYVLAQISQDFWIYVGTKQAGKSDELDKLFSEAKWESRPALLACDSKEALLFGPGINEGRILYAGASKADFLCRLRLLENTDYHWEIFGTSKRGPIVFAEDKLPTVTSSLCNTRRISTRWEIDARQAKGQFNFGNFLGSGWIGIQDGRNCREAVCHITNGQDQHCRQ